MACQGQIDYITMVNSIACLRIISPPFPSSSQRRSALQPIIFHSVLFSSLNQCIRAKKLIETKAANLPNRNILRAVCLTGSSATLSSSPQATRSGHMSLKLASAPLTVCWRFTTYRSDVSRMLCSDRTIIALARA